MVPYLFLIVAEMLNAMFKDEAAAGRIQGIRLLVKDRQ
jgi:hypothetical protein